MAAPIESTPTETHTHFTGLQRQVNASACSCWAQSRQTYHDVRDLEWNRLVRCHGELTGRSCGHVCELRLQALPITEIVASWGALTCTQSGETYLWPEVSCQILVPHEAAVEWIGQGLGEVCLQRVTEVIRV